MIHEIKIYPKFFTHVFDGAKTFELRKNDRDYKKGDFLFLREYDPFLCSYTGRATLKCVTYVLHGGSFGLQKGFVILSIR